MIIAKNSENLYLSYVSVGIISLFAIQVMINLGVVTGLFPVTGVTCNLEMLISTSYIGAFRGEFASFLLFFSPTECI